MNPLARSKPLAELAAQLGLPTDDAWAELAIGGVCEDSRRIAPGDLFVAIPGTRADGLTFAREAIARGAAAVVSEAPFRSDVPNIQVDDARLALAILSAAFHDGPTRDVFVVAVTGTNGKTTVCRLIAQILGDESTVEIGTVANEARGLRAVTTPSSPLVQAIARRAVDAGARHLVIEASSIGLEQRRLDAIDVDVAVFTNLSRDHFDLHGDWERYLSAKRRLFADLKPAAWAVVNADDPAGAVMLAAAACRHLTFAIRPATADRAPSPVDLTAGDVRLGDTRSSFVLGWDGRAVDVRLPLVGVHNVENAFAAAGVGIAAGRPLEEIAEALAAATPVPGRHRVLRRRDGATAVVDFAHNPAALERTLTTLVGSDHRTIVVFGCPGDGDRGKRAPMGAIAGRLADRVVITSDNPKHERPEAIAEEIAVGLRRTGTAWDWVPDRADAIHRAVDHASAQDVILVTGKGHETYQIVGDAFLPHSDEAILQSLGFVDASMQNGESPA